VLAANLAADLDAWTRLLGLHDHGDLADAEPDTLRYRLLHLPARLSSHARRRSHPPRTAMGSQYYGLGKSAVATVSDSR
jgi:hypothetical protein